MSQRKDKKKSLGKKAVVNSFEEDNDKANFSRRNSRGSEQETHPSDNTIKINVNQKQKNNKKAKKLLMKKNKKELKDIQDDFPQTDGLDSNKDEFEINEIEAQESMDAPEEEINEYDVAEIENLDAGEDEEDLEKQKEENIRKAIEFRESQNKKGVIYLSSVPPYMKVSQLRKLFSPYGVERIYLAPEDDSKRKFRIKQGGNKRRNYTEGWMEFNDKKVAKYVATVFNNQKIGGKRRSFYTEDILNLKYLPKFKWENLTEKINYDTKMRKEKLKTELSLAKKQHDHYLDQVDKGKKIMGIKKSKEAKRLAREDIDSAILENVEDDGEENTGMQLTFDDEKDRIRRVFKQKKPKLQ